MSNWADIASDIRQRVRVEVENGLSLPVAYDNAPFRPPATGLWVQLAIQPASRVPAAVGVGAKYRTRGVILFAVYAPVNEGDAAALQAADSIAAAFDALQLANVRTLAAEITGSGRANAGTAAYHRLNVSVPFYSDA
jgi:hypothetical protein